MCFNKDMYMKENLEYIKNINEGLVHLENISNELIAYGIDITQKPWYRNIIDIYIPKSQEYFKKCNDPNFDISKANDIWIRSEYKSFVSEVEKFTKFFIQQTLGLDGINFYRSINEFNNVISKYKDRFDENWKTEILNIKDVLDRWRSNYNENKHDIDKIDDCIFNENKGIFILGNDILEYVSDFIYRILCPLLATLLIIIKTK